jgi:hypothetical protein
MWLWQESIRILRSGSILLRLDAAIEVIEDLHSHFCDLLDFIALGGQPPRKRDLFLRDYEIAARTASRRCGARSRSKGSFPGTFGWCVETTRRPRCRASTDSFQSAGSTPPKSCGANSSRSSHGCFEDSIQQFEQMF